MKQNRNAPCPCGSGRKYKHCCLGQAQTNPTQPSQPVAQLFASARQLHQQGLLQQAEQQYRQILTQQKGHFDAQHLLGVCLHQQGRSKDAVKLLQPLTKKQPKFADLHNNLGLAQKAAEQLNPAIDSFRRALMLNSASLDFRLNLVRCLQQAQQEHAALTELKQALETQPESLTVLNELGSLNYQQGSCDDAIEWFQRALKLEPTNIRIRLNLINPLFARGRLDEIESQCRELLKMDPRCADAYYYLGRLAEHHEGFSDALLAYQKALEFNPKLVQAKHNLAMMFLECGELERAFKLCDETLALAPDSQRCAESRVSIANYDPNESPLSLAQRHFDLAQHYLDQPITPLFSRKHSESRKDAERIRVGYLSSDLKNHSVAYFFEPLLANHSSSKFDVYCYYNGTHQDQTTAKLKKQTHAWRDVALIDDAALSALIREDNIDILVELNGLTDGNRLKALASKPAPIQVSYLGYPNSTGMKAIDYRLVDPLTDPLPGAQRFASEKLCQLESGFLCYQPQPDLPAVELNNTDVITFGSFNALSKINARVIHTWSNILHAVPNSRLLLKSKFLKCPESRQLLEQSFSQLGIASERLELLGAVESLKDHMALYNQVDIALDTFPYNGATTTCEAIWMGVPVITLTGDRHAGRVGLSLLTNLGIPELIAVDLDHYTDLASELANDRLRINQYKQNLRQQANSSSLANGKRLALSIENAYLDMLKSTSH